MRRSAVLLLVTVLTGCGPATVHTVTVTRTTVKVGPDGYMSAKQCYDATGNYDEVVNQYGQPRVANAGDVKTSSDGDSAGSSLFYPIREDKGHVRQCMIYFNSDSKIEGKTMDLPR